ncbi:2-succinyl-6-hydroxy-2,4-cyclohexadiene-1-carboxylate synthase [uncultured archaeon]|nr:2-succinyl-6-hydroxy-2,4-cyclohexadiene-1-carboxylate synthase [uncultured archaeon]
MEKITFRTKDGVLIAGNYYNPQKEHSPVFLLLHMMPATKESWNTFALRLEAQGFACLAIDLRGHGESIDKNGKRIDYKEFRDAEHRDSMNDIESAKEFLARQKDVDISRFAVAGASIGANLALWQASMDKDVRLLVLLSAGLNYREIETSELASKYSGPVYILAGEGDTYAATSSRQLYDIFPGDKRLNIINGKLHGTNMFDVMPELIDELLEWIVQILLP